MEQVAHSCLPPCYVAVDQSTRRPLLQPQLRVQHAMQLTAFLEIMLNMQKSSSLRLSARLPLMTFVTKRSTGCHRHTYQSVRVRQSQRGCCNRTRLGYNWVQIFIERWPMLQYVHTWSSACGQHNLQLPLRQLCTSAQCMSL